MRYRGNILRYAQFFVHFSVKDIGHDRMALASYVFMTGINCTIETRDRSHAEHVRKRLEEAYGDDLSWQEDLEE